MYKIKLTLSHNIMHFVAHKQIKTSMQQININANSSPFHNFPKIKFDVKTHVMCNLPFPAPPTSNISILRKELFDYLFYFHNKMQNYFTYTLHCHSHNVIPFKPLQFHFNCLPSNVCQNHFITISTYLQITQQHLQTNKSNITHTVWALTLAFASNSTRTTSVLPIQAA